MPRQCCAPPPPPSCLGLRPRHHGRRLPLAQCPKARSCINVWPSQGLPVSREASWRGKKHAVRFSGTKCQWWDFRDPHWEGVFGERHFSLALCPRVQLRHQQCLPSPQASWMRCSSRALWPAFRDPGRQSCVDGAGSPRCHLRLWGRVALGGLVFQQEAVKISNTANFGI